MLINIDLIMFWKLLKKWKTHKLNKEQMKMVLIWNKGDILLLAQGTTLLKYVLLEISNKNNKKVKIFITENMSHWWDEG